MRLRRNYRCVVALLTLLVPTAFSVPASANPLEQVRNSISSLWTQKAKRQQKAQEAWNRAREVKQRAQTVHVRLEQSQRAYLEANAIYTNFARQTKKTEAEIVRTKHRTLIVSARLKRRRTLMGRRLASIQRAGKLSYMQLFLGSRSLSDLTRRATVFQAITSRDAELQNAIESDRDELQSAQYSLMAQWHKRNRLRQAAYREWLRVAQVRGKQDRLLRQLNASKAAQISYAKEQESSSRAITRMIQGLASRRDSMIAQHQRAKQKRLAARYAHERSINRQIEYSNESDSTFSGSSSGWGAPAGGGVTSPFGMRFHPVLHRTKLHTGTDFGAGHGAPIHAAKSGHVIFAGWQSAYGNMVIINHGGGFSTLYAHASSINVSSGQSVRRGQVIAQVGSTGFSTGPHLHFEIRINGVPVNPMRYLN